MHPAKVLHRTEAGDALLEGAPSHRPLYQEVKRLLTRSLVAGEWRPGEALPPERLLVRRFNVAMGTLRKAVDELVREKILVRQQGRGTFVAAHDRDRLMFYFFHIVRKDGTKEVPQVELLSFRKGHAGDEAAEKLRIERDSPIYLIANLLRIDGEPVILDDIVIPQKLFPGLTESRFRNRPSTIYHLYQTAFDITVVRSAERLRAISADHRSSALLGVSKRAPLLEVRRVVMTYNDAPIEFRRSLVNSKNYEYYSDLGMPNGNK